MALPSVDLSDVLSTLTGRRVRIGEIIAALNVGRSTYYEQRDEGRLLSADNLLRLAAEWDLNPVELMLHCGLIDPSAVTDLAARLDGQTTSDPGSGRAPRRRRFQLRPDAPPLS